MAPPKRSSKLTIEAAIGQALQLHKAGKRAQAEAAYLAALERAPNHPRALHFYGMWLHEQGRTDAAIAHLERSLAAAPDDLQVENNLAGLYLLAGRADDAERSFVGLVARAPDAVSSRFNLGVLYARSQRFVEAIRELEVARALVVDADVLRELGDALIGAKRFEEGVAAHREALELAPNDPQQKRNVCRAYSLLVDSLDRSVTDPEVAIAHLLRWLAIDPDDAIAQQTLAAYGGRAVPAGCSDDS